MDAMKISEIAHALYGAHGDAAELEAARRENLSRAEGNTTEADHWRAIRGSIRSLKGANQG
jgi:hypothetical protein